MSQDAITLVSRDQSALALNVGSELPAIFQLAKSLMQARGFIPSHLKNEGEVAAVILAGRELGLPPMASLRSVYLVNGKVGLSADVQLALMKRAGIRHEWMADGSDGRRAALKLERAGNPPYTQTFTIEDAERANLTKNPTWRAHTPAMLRARCVSAAAKAYAPDVLSGVYTPEELQEIEGGTEVRVTSTQAAYDAEFVDVRTGEVTALPKPTPVDDVKALVELELDACESREHLVAWAAKLLRIPASRDAKAPAWAAFQSKCLLVDPQLSPKEVAEEARKAGS